MRMALLAVWLLLPLAAWAVHEGPGQDWKNLDEVDEEIARAQEATADEAWEEAIEAYEAALASLPEDHVATARSLRLALAQARMQHEQLPKAREELETLVEEMTGDEDADPEVLAHSREALANARYYITWLMRLEGYPREEWEPEIEASRQGYRLLAEQTDADDAEGTSRRQDVESAVLLARLDLQELQGLPLPSQ